MDAVKILVAAVIAYVAYKLLTRTAPKEVSLTALAAQPPQAPGVPAKGIVARKRKKTARPPYRAPSGAVRAAKLREGGPSGHPLVLLED